MHAAPIVPGFLYHVTGTGISLDILAKHGADAICIALGLFCLIKD